MFNKHKGKPKGLFLFAIMLVFLGLVIGVVSAETLEVAHWTFNETSGTTLIDIAGDNNGTNNGATINQTGKINKAYSFDGTNDYILINDLNQNSRTRSINTWFKLNSSNAYDVFFWAYSNEGTKSIWCRSEDSTSTTRCTYDNDVISTINRTSEYDDNQWHMLTYIINNTSQKLYIDGVYKNSTSEITTSFNINDLYLGSRNGDLYADVFLDDTRIYDFDLNLNDIALIYNDGDGTEEPLNVLINSQSIENPSLTVYSTISYDWNAGYIDSDYNSDYTYEYSFGFNETDSFDGDEIFADTNQTLDYNQNTFKYFDLDYTPTTNQIGDTNYSFFKVYRYLDSVYDSNQTAWSSDTFEVIDCIDLNIVNPTPPIYPTISSDWNAGYIDKAYSSTITYEYSLGFNDTNSFDGDEIFADINQTLDYDQNTIKYFDLDYTPTVAQIDDVNYSFFTVHRYIDSTYDSYETAWSSNTFTVADNIVFDFNAPAYPDWANVFYPTKSYSGSAHYQDKSFQTGITTYKYDLGANDTNSFDGAEDYWKQNLNIDSVDGNVDAYFEHTIDVADKGKTLYAFLTLKRYYNDVFIDSETNWTDSFDVNYGKFRVQFYDENSGVTLDGNVEFENTISIPVDENGLVYVWLEDYITADGQAIETDAYREVDGVITHTARSFDYYLYLTRSYDINFALLPIDMGGYIEFLVKSTDDELWANKYLLFSKSTADISPLTQTLIDSYSSASGTTSDKRGIKFHVLTDCYMNGFHIEQTINYFDSWELYDYNLGTILDSGTGLVEATDEIDTSTAIKLNADNEYSLVLFNHDSSTGTFAYTNNYLSSPVTTTYLSYDNGCSDGGISCTSTDAFIIKSICVMDGTGYDNFFISSLTQSILTDSVGKATAHVLVDGNYEALLVTEFGSIQDLYVKTTVDLAKPKDEITLMDVSPYDVDIGGLLIYSLSNQSVSDINFNIFAGTTGYYDFTVVDYNASPIDREYIPRNYGVRVALGSGYFSLYNLQPYLIKDVDGIIPKLKVIDQLNRAVNDAVVIIFKNIEGSNTVVESAITDSTGSMSWSVYPLDLYTIAVYYNEELKGTYTLRPRTSDDIYYITINLSADDVLGIPTVVNLDWGNTVSYFNLNSQDIEIKDAIINSNKLNITGYVAKLYQGTTLIDSNTYVVDNVSSAGLDYVFDSTTIDTSMNTAIIKVTVEYAGGLEREFIRKIVLNRRSSPVNFFISAKDDLGQPLAVILALFITGLLLTMLTFSGLPLGKLGIAIFGVVVLGVFMWIGWLDSGVMVMGFDVSRFMYVLVALGIMYFAFKEGVR